MKDISLAYEKKIIGFLISYYRKENGLSVERILHNKKIHYEQYCLECTRCKDKEMICSNKTLRKIENGELVKNDCIYYRLSENLNKSICFQRSTYSLIYRLRVMIYENLIDFSYTKLSKILSTLTLEMTKHRNEIYVYEILSFYHDLMTYRTHGTLPETEQLNLYLYLFEKVEGVDSKLMSSFLYNISLQINQLYVKRNQFIENHLNDLEDDPLFFQIKVMRIADQDLLDAYFDIHHEMKQSLNLYQKYILYNYKGYVEMNTRDYKRAYETMRVCLQMIEEGADFGPYITQGILRRIGMISFYLKDYEKTIEYLDRALMNEVTMLGMQAVFLYRSLEKTKQTDRLKALLNQIHLDNIQNEMERKITIYYKRKYQSEPLTKKQMSELEDYICEEIKPFLNRMGDLLKNIFLDDLLNYVEKTSNYKKLYLYENKEES